MKRFLLMLMTAFFLFTVSACHLGAPPKQKNAKQETVVQKIDAIQMVQVADQNSDQVYFVRNVTDVPDINVEKQANSETVASGQPNEYAYKNVRNSRLAPNEQNRLPIVRAVYQSDQSSGDAKYYLTQAVDSTGNQEGGAAGIFDWIYDNWGVIASILLLLSEIIGGSKLKSNAIYQLIFPFLRNSATRLKE